MPAVLVVLVTLLMVAACGGDDDTVATGSVLPEWIESVHPLPDSSATANTVVEVSHTMTDPDHELRLIVDGADVTGDAVSSPGLIVFDGLDLGSHTATVERVLAPVGDAPQTVIDSFTWTFDTL